MARRWQAKALVAGALLLCCCAALEHGSSYQQRQRAQEQLFQKLDANKDGEVTAAETAQYVGQDGGFDWLAQEGWSVAAATQHSQEALDGADAGGTVSQAELAAHLRALLQDHQVVDWVEHGLGLLQYAAAFKRNAVTALDFPLLLSDAGATLASDLGVTSRLHQQQILRGLKRLVLGLGQLPSPPQQLECAAVNKSTVRLSWQPPASAGHPPYHKYLLQRQLLAAGAAGGSRGAHSRCSTGGPPDGSSGSDSVSGWSGVPSCPAEPWEMVADPDDELSSWLDAPPAAGSYRYRLTAWSAFGRSAYAYTPAGCAVEAAQRLRSPPAQLLPPSDVQALLASLAAGSNLSAQQGAPVSSGKAWSWSAASSAVIVTLTILVKASQLRVAARLAALWRLAAGALARRRQAADEAAVTGELWQRRSSAVSGAAGVPRVDSSRASLASLADEAAAPDELKQQRQQQQQQWLGSQDAADSSLLGLSSSQLLTLASSQGLTLDPSSEIAAAATVVLPADGALHDAAAEQLAQAIKRGHHCGHPGCHRRFDRLRDVRRRLESHYCGLCQRVFCLQHTRISPHGPRGACGLDSSCLCFACYAELASAQQTAYERVNRLPPGRTCDGSNGSGVEKHEAAAAVSGAAPAAASGLQDETPTLTGTSPAAAEAAAAEAAAAAASAEARRRWRKAGGLLRALVRFKASVADKQPAH